MPRRSHLHHHAIVYPVSFGARIYTIVIGPLIVVGLVALAAFFYPALSPEGSAVSLSTIALASFATCARLAIAYVLAVLIGVPLSIAVTRSPMLEAIFLPIFDVLESVPILALFPVFIMLFIQSGFFNAAAIAILFFTMLWNIVFTVVGGIKIIPKDILYAAHIFGLRGLSLYMRVIVPAIVPQFITGSILAVAQGWNIIIVAEVLHTYIPGGTAAQDLFGVGALLVQASASGQTQVFLACVLMMIVLIAFFNFFVWQKLLHYAQRFKFE